jgi:prolipoprotein diacylglyceryl transferase
MFSDQLLPITFILWDMQPEIFPGTSIPLRWYGLLFAAAFLCGQFVMQRIFKAEGKPEKDIDVLTYYMIGATIIGARLGHCLFYQPEIYLNDPIEILKVWEGGLASHGAAIGIFIAMWFYSRNRPGQSFLWTLDRIVIIVALGGAFIRMGNLMNSEIIGKPADLPWSMVFAQPLERTLERYEGSRINDISVEKTGEKDTVIDGKTFAPVRLKIVFKPDQLEGSSEEAFIKSSLPSMIEASNHVDDTTKEEHFRYNWTQADLKSSYDKKGNKIVDVKLFGLLRHPAMVYESISTFLLFVVLFGYWKRNVGKVPEGRMFSFFFTVLFTVRFFYEFLKENQVRWEDGLTLNMGQYLSIPLVLIGLGVFIYSFRKPPVDSEQKS